MGKIKGMRKVGRCIVCHRKFYMWRKGALYCTDKCRSAAYRMRQEQASGTESELPVTQRGGWYE